MVSHALPQPIAAAMGDQVYLMRHADRDELLKLIHLTQERA